MEHEIYISREKTGLGHNGAAGLIKKAVGMALDAEGVGVPCIISVMLTDDEGIHAVNKEFRNVDRVTDVLSFPLNELTPGEFDPDECERDLDTGAADQDPAVLSETGDDVGLIRRGFDVAQQEQKNDDDGGDS